MLTADQIEKNWNSFFDITTQYIESSKNPDRWKLLSEFYDKHANKIAVIPASSKTSYHNAFEGGYVDHVLRVYDAAFKFASLWKEYRGKLDFRMEELAMVALNHDLGKIGDEVNDYYVEQDSKWHRERGELYKYNPALPFMKVSDRSLFLLQKIGVELSEKEYLAIKLHDGLYEEANKSYYVAFSEEYKLRTDLPYILHQADLLSARVESPIKKF